MSLTKAVEKYINEIKDNLPSFQMDPGYILAELSSHDRTSSFTVPQSGDVKCLKDTISLSLQYSLQSLTNAEADNSCELVSNVSNAFFSQSMEAFLLLRRNVGGFTAVQLDAGGTSSSSGRLQKAIFHCRPWAAGLAGSEENEESVEEVMDQKLLHI
ncbi:hypothetical protein Anapl_05094 [Anas platyrhynchos]|uniref:Uncharacterized protein n=1 Tax=Anas platyrhynchos TaxID=8839 RepID=R0KWP7_ANAPL|nr:hypothetical protein Anapl_05094 [Anas platyrhynchos]